MSDVEQPCSRCGELTFNEPPYGMVSRMADRRLPTVTAEWLRELAELVERGDVEVIRCDLKTGGIVLGVVAPRDPAPAE
jgi:hypothetical protein